MKAITDTLPHNSNLCLWKKIQSDHYPICSSDSIQHRQTQLHVLNNCPTALKQDRYNVRHDKVLLILFHHLQANVPPSFCVTADLDGTDYRIPQYLLTDLFIRYIFLSSLFAGKKISRMLQSGRRQNIYTF